MTALPEELMREARKAADWFGFENRVKAIAKALRARDERASAIIDAEIERAKSFGPQHVPILRDVQRAILTYDEATHDR